MEFSVGSGPKFTGPFLSNAKESLEITSFRFSISCPILGIFTVKVRSGRKSPVISHIFGAIPPNFWIYLIEPLSDHVAKFHSDRSRELEENLAKEKRKNITGKI